VEDRGELFARAGVVDGLRLQECKEIPFRMSDRLPDLPGEPPDATPRAAWDEWRKAVLEDVKPPFVLMFHYELSEVRLLPAIHHLADLNESGRKALSDLLLASFPQWDDGWESAAIRKASGAHWQTRVASPLKHWLTTLPWLMDRSGVKPLRCRWLVPEFLLRNQRQRYEHLDPLSPKLARRLNAESGLLRTLEELGLNVYPTEEEQTGPGLLDALAEAWSGGRVPTGRFDAFLGQVRDAWQHLHPDMGLPERFLVRSGHRKFSIREAGELTDAYLPDDRNRAGSLREHEKPILEMRPAVAGSKADALVAATNIHRASRLDERFVVDGATWTGDGATRTGPVDGIRPLDETRYASWLPVVLLTVLAHGGVNPTGANTEAWRTADGRLRRMHVLECERIAVELVDGDRVAAGSEPQAAWLPGDVLAVRRDASHEDLAPAAQAMLERQDLLKDLRLVLGALAGHEKPTRERIEEALKRAEIDAQEFADVSSQWDGPISLVVDRIRPVLARLGIQYDGIEAATNSERLTEWLDRNVPRWPVADMLSAARRSRDDQAMGEAAWRALGDVAQLPAWNDALATLADPYGPVDNHRVD